MCSDNARIRAFTHSVYAERREEDLKKQLRLVFPWLGERAAENGSRPSLDARKGNDLTVQS